MLKKTVLLYVLGIGLVFLTIPIVEGVMYILPDIGWYILLVLYLTIFMLQILFYYLTTYFNLGWTAFSFVLNLLLLMFEFVLVERYIPDSFLSKRPSWSIGGYFIGGVLWVTNKILLDKLVLRKKDIHKQPNRVNL